MYKPALLKRWFVTRSAAGAGWSAISRSEVSAAKGDFDDCVGPDGRDLMEL